MKKLAFIIIVFLFSVPAIAQDTVQNVTLRIMQLQAQQSYNNSLILDLNRKALSFDQEIAQQRAKLQELNKPAPKAEPKAEKLGE